ncbi:MAG: GTP-binding protein [Chloroflexi bacterium]|nr:GTP-binding protein [Chloroflexota bacterium]
MKSIQRKICLLGDYAVGKTSLIRRFVHNKFDTDYLATIGVHVSRKELEFDELDEPTNIVLVLWDLAGGETFSQMEQAYYRGGAGALLVADVTRPETFDILNSYANTFTQINPGASLKFVFNKCDLVADSNIHRKQAESVAARWQAPVFFTSAYNGQSVESAFKALAYSLIM